MPNGIITGYPLVANKLHLKTKDTIKRSRPIEYYRYGFNEATDQILK